MNLQIFSQGLYEINQKGFLPTVRRGETGVALTLEQNLGLIGSNLFIPDSGEKVELKVFRRNTDSMFTLFTKEPMSKFGRSRDRYLLETFGKNGLNPSRISNLYTTVSATSTNSKGFKLEVNGNLLRLCHKTIPLDIYWPYELLKGIFEQKLPAIVVVLSDTIGSGFDEQFSYNEAYYLKGFNFQGFIAAIEAGEIKVDIRISVNLKKNSSHNHGTAFRVIKPKICKCFELKQKIL